jgi:hypothetical protein
MEGAMRILLTAAIVLACGSSAIAQNAMSKRLLALTEDQRNLAFTRLMAANHEACDRAIKTVFNASVGTIDDWEMLCNDGNSYSMSVPDNPNEIIKYLSCKELAAVGKMLDKRAGVKGKGGGCRIK